MLTLNYVGGGSFSNDGSVSNGVIQGLNFSERLSYRRFVLSFFEQFLYAPQNNRGGRNSKWSDSAWWWNVRVRQWLRAGTVNLRHEGSGL